MDEFLEFQVFAFNGLDLEIDFLIDVLALQQQFAAGKKGDQRRDRGDARLHRSGAEGQPLRSIDMVQSDE